MNGKKANISSNQNRKGTGIENIRRRLELLYSNRHTLEIKDDLEIFIVYLRIELGNKNSEKKGP